jgi:DNA-binding HxlR family transcriptional regulator
MNEEAHSAIRSTLVHALRAWEADARTDMTIQRLLRLSREMMLHGAQRTDPIREVFGRLGDRWSMLILLVLESDTFRHAELRSVVGALSDEGAISQRMLTLRLRDLERSGFIKRHATHHVPHRVDYSLSDLGRTLLWQVSTLMDWVKLNTSTIRRNQNEFDRSHS